MSHILRRPFLTEDPTNLHANRTLMVSRLAAMAPGVLACQGRPVGNREAALVTWAASQHDVANLLYAYTVGYRGMLHLPLQGDVWAELAEKIARERSKG